MGCRGETHGVGRAGVGRREAWLKEGYLVAEPFVCNGCLLDTYFMTDWLLFYLKPSTDLVTREPTFN